LTLPHCGAGQREHRFGLRLPRIFVNATVLVSPRCSPMNYIFWLTSVNVAVIAISSFLMLRVVAAAARRAIEQAVSV
jgi:hypothetical protein